MNWGRKIPVITKKILMVVILTGILLCSLVFAAGYWSFSRQFKKQYDSSIRSIAEAARQCIYPDDFALYIETKSADEKYKTAQVILQDFVDKFDLNMIYISAVNPPDYTHITYIHNLVKKGGKWTEYPLGYEEDYLEPNYNASTRRVFENGETIVRHTLKTRSGSHITAQIPVFDSNKKIVAVLGVQKDIQTFVNARYSFINFVVALEIFFALAAIVLFSLFFEKTLIKPIVMIKQETDRFASQGGEPDERLLSIKNHDEIGSLAHSVHQMELDVVKNIAEMTRLTAEKERISTELALASKIQLDMLPKDYPPFPDRSEFDLFATMTAAKEVGGDLYDYLLLDSDHLMMTVGDVSGKGMPAALFMGKTKVLLDFYAYLGLSPKEIFEKTNEQLCKGNDSGLFVTCWLGILTISTGELRFVNAGHPYPVIFQGGKLDWLKRKPNLMLGTVEGFPYQEYSITISRGDRLFVYTDGVSEAMNASEELFGDERLLEVLDGTEALSAPDTLSKVRKAVDCFVKEAEQFDDITMLQFICKK